MSVKKLLLLRCLADDRSPVKYLANEKSYSWDNLLALRSEGLVSIGAPGPKRYGSNCICTLAKPASAHMTLHANAYARSRDYNLRETAASREILAYFEVAVQAWVQGDENA